MVADSQPVVDAAEHDIRFLVGVLSLHDERTHHRAQGQRHYGREQYGHNDGHGELAVELSGDTSQEADRDEYRSQYQ